MSIDTTKKIKQVTYNGTEIPLRGYDTSDATVTAGDMASGVVAYGASGKVTGGLQDLNSYAYIATTKSSIDDWGSSIVVNSLWPDNVLGIVKQGAKKFHIKTEIQTSEFGNATAADVAKGKTFTSAAGLKVAGMAGIETVSFSMINRYSDELWVSFPEVDSSAEGDDSVSVTRGAISVGQTVEIEVPANAMITVLGTDKTASDMLTVDKAIPSVNYNGGLTLMSFVALATLAGRR